MESNKEHMIQACIFDLDGVIVDTAIYHFKAWRRMANELGFDFSEKENEQLKGVSRVDSLNLILKWGGVSIDEAKKVELAERKNDWYLEFIDGMTEEEILPGVVPFLDSLKAKGIKIALGSASKNAVKVLTSTGILDYFLTIVDGNQVVNGKPDPEVFLKGAATLGVDPAHCIIFEDAERGVEAALRGGFYAIGVGDPVNLHKAHLVIPGFESVTLEKLVEQIPNLV